MKVLYTVKMNQRYMPESELLTSMIKDAIKGFNMLMKADATFEHAHFRPNDFQEGSESARVLPFSLLMKRRTTPS
jgi:hypothetical protein